MAVRSDDTIPALFLRQAESFGSRTLFLSHQPNGQWQSTSWQDARLTVAALGAYLLSQNVERGERILILSENRSEWAIADIAIQTVGAWSVPLYPTLQQDDILRIANDCEASIAIVSSQEQLDKLRAIHASAPSLRRIIALTSPAHEEEIVISWEQALMRGAQQQTLTESKLSDRSRSIQADDTATLIYTSGTTGEPKGVMLSHRNFLSNVAACLEVIPISGTDTHLSFLPLSHVFERMAGWYLMLSVGASVAYAQNIDSVPEDMRSVRPTIMLGVPRFFEKLHSRILDHIQTLPEKRQRIIRTAIAIGERYRTARLSGGRIPLFLRLQHAAARLFVFRKFHERLGGRLRFFVSGGAPLSKELGEFFYSIGLTIIEGYGLTETSPVIAVNRVQEPCFGTVGQPVPGVEVQIAQDGEVLTRGPHIMQGYYRKPDATASVIKQGWFYTGDIGHLDQKGRLSITDRKKDLIKTSGGKFVAPQKLEGLFCANPHISQAFVYGDRQPYCVALIVPKRSALDAFAEQNGLDHLSLAELLAHPKVQAFYWSIVQERQSGLPGFEQVKRIALLEQEFSLSSGELTPTLKAKRQFIADKYASVLRSLYVASGQTPPHPA